jgi:hypothetical protein
MKVEGIYEMATVKELLEQYENGVITWPRLLSALASHEYTKQRVESRDWAEVYARAEEMPEDNSFFWIEAAEFSDVLTEDQVEKIAEAIDRYHRQKARA